MKPFAPEVVGPVSICNAAVEVKGTIVGATIEILAGTTTTASHVCKIPDDFYAIGVTLAPNQIITARQTIGGQTSTASLPVIVQDAPSQLGALTVRTLLHTCGRAIRVTGAVPGAKVDVLAGSQQIGASSTPGGWAGIVYDAGAAAGPLTLKQITCNNLTATQSTVAPVAPPSPLPVPRIQAPLFECQSRITIGGVVEGAYVELYRNNESTPEDRFVFGLAEEFRWIKPLVKNDVIKVRQGFSCKTPAPPLETASGYASTTVQPVASLYAPKFLSVPCPGSTYVTLGKLVPGARVVLTQNGVELGETDAPDVVYTFPTPALTAGATLEAHMEMCNGKGPSASIQVSNQPVSPSGIADSPPYACAAFVAFNIQGQAGNYLAYLTNKNGQQISAYYNVIGISAFIPVWPSLVAGDQISYHLQGCGGTWKTYGPVTVLSGPPQPTVQQPLYAGYNHCAIVAMAGFVLNIYVNNVWKATALSQGIYNAVAVTLPAALQPGDQVTCTQTVCGVPSKPSSPITVVHQPPQRPVLVDPPNGASDVLLQPQFKWQDPGAGTPGAATSFQLLVTQSGSPVINVSVAGTTYTSSVAFANSTSYLWNVTSINAGGSESAASAYGFSTEPPPPPPTATLKFHPPMTTSVPGNEFARGQNFDVTIEIVNQGSAASGAYSVVFTERSSDGTTTLAPPYTKQMPALGAGGTASASAQAFIDATYSDAVRIDAYLMVSGQQVDNAWLVG